MRFCITGLIIINFVFANDKKFTLTGHIENRPQEMQVLFKEYNTLQNVQTLLQTIPVTESGDFYIDLYYPPGIYQIDFTGIRTLNFAIDYDQTVNIDLEVPENESLETRVQLSGSKDAVLVFEYDKKQKEAYKKWLNPVRRNIRLAKEAGQTEKIPALSEQEKKNLKAYKNELADYTRENFGHSIALFYAAIRLDPDLHMDFLQEISNIFNRQRPELELTQQFNERIKRIKQTAVGSKAPLVSLINEKGQSISLKDFKGQYVLLDFWAAWCNPCRIENLNYNKLYKKYNKKGFEIFAISIDTNKRLWQSASKKDKITWINVIDQKGWASPAAVTYNVTAIPANFLIDKDGIIIAKNIRGKDLQKKLAELLD